MNPRVVCFTISFSVLLLFTDAAEKASVTSPLTPEQSLKHFQIEPGLRVELVAAEPLVASPCAIAFDERGRLYVAENRGYPVGPGEGKTPSGVIALLEDTNGDGIYDKRTEFATGLSFPNGLMCWKGGVFVTCAPDIFYLKDTKGDGVADVKQLVLTGFSTNSTTQLRTSHPTLGLDGWIYVTAGLVGGKVSSPLNPSHPVLEYARGDLRFKPDASDFESVPGVGQFGLAMDGFGRKFVCSNRNPMQHVVMWPRYLKRNPYLAFTETVQEAARFGEQGRVFPISPDTTTAGFMPGLMSHPHAGTFTSACGLCVYRGTALGANFAGSAFICEPAQNLVQRQVVSPDGATFTAKLAREGAEFFASPDSWCRPVFAANGPDGALYICDMYRKTIEHPQYLPEALRPTTDFVSGKNMGRIWRIVADSQPRRVEGIKFKSEDRQTATLAQAKPAELVAALNHPIGWTRDTARRLLLEKADAKSAPLLRSALAKSPVAEARVAALRLLDCLGGLNEADIKLALADKSGGVREHAVQLAEPRLRDSADLLARVSSLADDPDARVRFVTALALGESFDPRVMSVLARIAARDAGDRWTRAAVLSSIGRAPDEFLRDAMATPHADDANFGALMSEFGRSFGAGQPPEKCLEFINEVLAPGRGTGQSWQADAVSGLAEGLRARGFAKGGQSALMTLVANGTPAATKLAALMDRSRDIALNTSRPAPERVAAIGLLAQAGYDVAGGPLLSLINPREKSDLQLAAVRAYGQLNDAAVGLTLVSVERWRAYLPPVREAVLAAVFAQPRHLPALLDAVEKGTIPPWAIEPNRRNQLLNNKDAALKQRAAAVFKNAGGDRQKVFEEYKAVLALKGDGKNGSEMFKKTCANCHTHNGVGTAVGPDLSGVRNQPPEALLLHIIIPEAEILPIYTNYEVETRDGRSTGGLLAGETETSITLRRALGEQETIPRSNIASLRASNLSLMPQELEKTMTKQEFADLIAFLKGQ